jgi:hypothetical protein
MQKMQESNALAKEMRVQALGQLAPYMPLMQMMFRRHSNIILSSQTELDNLLPKVEERFGWEERYGCQKLNPIEMHEYTHEFVEDVWELLVSKKSSNFTGLRRLLKDPARSINSSSKNASDSELETVEIALKVRRYF